MPDRAAKSPPARAARSTRRSTRSTAPQDTPPVFDLLSPTRTDGHLRPLVDAGKNSSSASSRRLPLAARCSRCNECNPQSARRDLRAPRCANLCRRRKNAAMNSRRIGSRIRTRSPRVRLARAAHSPRDSKAPPSPAYVTSRGSRRYHSFWMPPRRLSSRKCSAHIHRAEIFHLGHGTIFAEPARGNIQLKRRWVGQSAVRPRQQKSRKMHREQGPTRGGNRSRYAWFNSFLRQESAITKSAARWRLQRDAAPVVSHLSHRQAWP